MTEVGAIELAISFAVFLVIGFLVGKTHEQQKWVDRKSHEERLKGCNTNERILSGE